MADYGSELVGTSPAIEALRRLVERIGGSPTRTVLIYGETGVGKGLVARMIHQMSSRANRDFVDINCAALPANLMESELFGHEKGAFTGAIDRKLGLVEAADHGSVFLDEIRELDLTLQAKLLTLLDTQQFRRVGAVKPVKVDVRFIAATNKVLLSEVTSGRFREDLYYRLQVVAVNLPALRERGEDVLTLARHFIARFNKSYGRTMRGLAPETEKIFLRYTWPGNVRELENLLERIFILEDEDMILPQHLPDRILRSVSGRVDQFAAMPLNGSEDYHAATDSFQRAMISQAMAEANANPQEAAKLLGLSRHALRHQMTKLGLLKS
ncbi:MAG: sigma-54 dependent transcriptional regulator [Pseudotabrizicola sp.]|uniref:sigma-54 interaction domain-containing protein n=1 Tax=Pseudotabrizicola sp. TaxID=2939647 RepID=UPI002718F316|nr:sigma-54 dependent transcriptional regulator [Pseudotabrizicola sp.]MDO8883357.1 sigma-54 dependent transcriptional regulator [Pseudotabrizicola sp.]MDP2080930.1 sigma-54 dependent transcriptional regulator [Pseudotabrizicola sp.]MDZ7572668.1 sigma-54 dependent transcriptional regulator [Pseudotabrizicola sp.]